MIASAPLPPELALAAACCRWPPAPERDVAVRDAVARGIDWARFQRIVAHHRIAPLASHGLRRAGVAVPAPVERGLADAAAAAARRALVHASETLRLQRAFDEAALPAIFLKGTTLEMLAYGELGLKEAWDIDLLTTADGVVEASGLLQQLGYRPQDPQLADPAMLARLAPLYKEAVFHHPERACWVELHWRLMDNPVSIPGTGAASPTQDVQLAGRSARTLHDEPLYAYLCMHGALHGWSRLKWLADLSAFLATRPDRIGVLHDASAGFAATRTSGFALLLCHHVLGLALPAGLLEQLSGDRSVRALARNCLAGLTHRAGEPPDLVLSVPALRTRAARFVLTPGGRHFWHEARLNWISVEDRSRFVLPPGLGFLYHVLRIPLSLWRIGRRAVGNPAP